MKTGFELRGTPEKGEGIFATKSFKVGNLEVESSFRQVKQRLGLICGWGELCPIVIIIACSYLCHKNPQKPVITFMKN
ncbi:MAG: hypothetical protein ACE5EA_09565 [Nitrospirota bacterium]